MRKSENNCEQSNEHRHLSHFAVHVFDGRPVLLRQACQQSETFEGYGATKRRDDGKHEREQSGVRVVGCEVRFAVYAFVGVDGVESDDSEQHAM